MKGDPHTLDATSPKASTWLLTSQEISFDSLAGSASRFDLRCTSPLPLDTSLLGGLLIRFITRRNIFLNMSNEKLP